MNDEKLRAEFERAIEQLDFKECAALCEGRISDREDLAMFIGYCAGRKARDAEAQPVKQDLGIDALVELLTPANQYCKHCGAALFTPEANKTCNQTGGPV